MRGALGQRSACRHLGVADVVSAGSFRTRRHRCAVVRGRAGRPASQSASHFAVVSSDFFDALGLVRTQRRARVLYPCLLVAGWACYTGALYWMSVADPRMAFAWIFLALPGALVGRPLLGRSGR